MFRRFLRDKSANYAMMTVIAMLPIMGGVALAVDYTELTKERQETMNALDAAGIATARYILAGGVTETQIKQYAKDFFEANLGSVSPSKTILTVTLPQNTSGGGTLKLTANLKYSPYFYPAFVTMLGVKGKDTNITLNAKSEIRLKNTLEIALVLDNSGSMDTKATGSSKKRIEVLKDASKVLVDLIAGQATLIKQVNKPVQFSLVPFSASVNIGPSMADKTWMDQDGISPIHHENFAWSAMPSAYAVTLVNGVYKKTGASWPAAIKNQKVTRFTLFNELKYYTNNGQTVKANYASWQGCVETRPYPYSVNDAVPTTTTPATLFVPMFAPDEVSGADNNYWSDVSTSSNALTRQSYPGKYFDGIGSNGYVAPYGTTPAGLDVGPNSACTTSPITQLVDVSETAGLNAIKASIDAMAPTGNTNVPEGMAWGWRTLSSAEPFTGGRAESEKGNDKVLIVLTDGANTYSAVSDSSGAGNRSTYASYGYAGRWPTGYTTSRVFQGTSSSVSKTDYSSTNYTKAMDEQFKILCDNAKAANLIVMTVSLDLKTSVTAEKKAMDALKACSSDSRFRKDANGNPEKLYWNATGGDLSETFKKIGDELSNLRIVG